MNSTRFDPNWIPPPGATVEDLLSRRGTSARSQLLGRLGEVKGKALIEGTLSIDDELAIILSTTIGLPVSFWIERERQYRAELQKREFEKQFLSKVPLVDMTQRRWTPPVSSHAETVADVVEFFGKENAEECNTFIDQVPTLIKQKTSQTAQSRPGSLAVWVRAGEIEASRVECAPWSRDRLEFSISELRALTRTENPEQFVPALKSICSACGIALVVLRAPVGCVARGAIEFISSNKVMLLLSGRHLSNDQFWFSFFHEVAHLLLHAEDQVIIDDWDDSESDKELEADDLASKLLIPAERQRELGSLNGKLEVVRFARSVGVGRGIVVGQMQHRGHLRFESFNNLKIYYRWDNNNQLARK